MIPTDPSPPSAVVEGGDVRDSRGARRGGAFGHELEAMRKLLSALPEGGRQMSHAMGREGGRDWPPSWAPDQIAAAGFLAHAFSRLRRLRCGGGNDGRGRLPWVWRPAVRCGCAYGTNLAGPGEFAEQATAAQLRFDWDRAQAHVLKRLESGRTPLVLDLFCCAGARSI